MAGVIPIIFASSLLLFPVVLGQFAAGGDQDSILGRIAAFFQPPSAPYLILYAFLILMFTYFYTAVQFNPVEHADNLKKSGGYVPGIRPGQPTAVYLNNVLTRITLFGAIFLAVVAVRSEEHTSELQSRQYLVCRLLLEKKKHKRYN